jgi:hypothetical protein
MGLDNNSITSVPHMIHTSEFGLVGVAIGCEAIDASIWPMLSGAPPPSPRSIVTSNTKSRTPVASSSTHAHNNTSNANTNGNSNNSNHSYHSGSHSSNSNGMVSPGAPLPLSVTVSDAAATITPSILLIPFSAPTLPHHPTFYPTAERDAYVTIYSRLYLVIIYL